MSSEFKRILISLTEDLNFPDHLGLKERTKTKKMTVSDLAGWCPHIYLFLLCKHLFRTNIFFFFFMNWQQQLYLQPLSCFDSSLSMDAAASPFLPVKTAETDGLIYQAASTQPERCHHSLCWPQQTLGSVEEATKTKRYSGLNCCFLDITYFSFSSSFRLF